MSTDGVAIAYKRHTPEISLKGNPLLTHKKKEWLQFILIEKVTEDLNTLRNGGKKWVRLLEIVSKVIVVFTSLLSIALPLAFFYLPAWVSWGIGLPVIIGLAIAQSKLKSKIEDYERDVYFLPMLKEFLERNSAKALSPLGEWDLDKVDERLKSDLLMKEALKKRHPKSAAQVVRMLDQYGLENSVLVNKYAACRFANVSRLKTKWRGVIPQAKNDLAAVTTPEEFDNKSEEVSKIAYETPFPTLKFPTTVTEELETLVFLYQNVERRFVKIEQLKEEGEELYSDLDFLEGGPLTQWDAYVEARNEVKASIESIAKKLSYKRTRATHLLRVLKKAQSEHLKYNLFALIQKTERLEKELKGWIGAHPQSRLISFEKEFLRYRGFEQSEKEGRDFLTPQLFNQLVHWIEENPSKAHTTFDHLSEKSRLPSSLKNWILKYPPEHVTTMTPWKLRERNIRYRETKHFLTPQLFNRLFQWIEENPTKAHTTFDHLIAKNRVPRALKKWILKYQPEHAATMTPWKLIEHTIKHREKTKQLLDREQMTLLDQWVQNHSVASQKNIIELQGHDEFPVELKKWIKTNREVRFITPVKLLDQSLVLQQAYNETYDKFLTLKGELPDFAESEESFNAYHRALDEFNKQEMVPLRRCIERRGGTSFWKNLFKVAFAKKSAKPFEIEPLPQEKPLRLRKIEEIRLTEALKTIDWKMVVTNRTRVWGLRAPLYLLFAIEGIFALYFATPWIFWGLSVLTVAVEGVSHYINYRLKLMDREKQALKLQHLLMNHPDIGRVAGIHSELKELKSLQAKYGLEGVRPTWARVLSGDKQLETLLKKTASAGRQEALTGSKETLKKLAAEGSKEATRNLEKWLILAYSRYYELKPASSKAKRLWQRIRNVEKSLEPQEPKPPIQPKPISRYEELSLQRAQADRELDSVVEQMLQLQIKLEDYEKRSIQFEQLKETFSEEFVRYSVSDEEIEFLLEVYNTSQPIEEELDAPSIVPLLFEVKQLLHSSTWLRVKQLRFSSLAKHKELLLQVPKPQLYQYILNLGTLQILQKDGDYINKENIDAKIERINEILESLEERRVGCKKQYDKYARRMTRLHTPVARVETPKERLDTALKEFNIASYPNTRLWAEAVKQQWDQKAHFIRSLYWQLNSMERASIWWQLPECFRDELSGVAFRRYAVENAQEALNDDFWGDNSESIKADFMNIAYENQKNVFASLPPSFKHLLEPFYLEFTGEGLLKECDQFMIDQKLSNDPEEYAQTWWRQNKRRFIREFKELPLYYQESLYTKIPRPILDQFKSHYEQLTGAHFIAACRSALEPFAKESSDKKFNRWWQVHKAKIRTAYLKIDRNYVDKVHQALPQTLRTKLDAFVWG